MLFVLFYSEVSDQFDFKYILTKFSSVIAQNQSKYSVNLIENLIFLLGWVKLTVFSVNFAMRIRLHLILNYSSLYVKQL